MKTDACCTESGFRKYMRPTVVSVVAGLIVLSAGILKLTGGWEMMGMVGGMALGGIHIDGSAHGGISKALGLIAAIIEVVGGFSFLIGCRKTSKYSALLLSIVMFFAVLSRISAIQPVQGNWFQIAAGTFAQFQFELLLFAVFFQKGLKLIMCWCGMECSGCCSMPMKK